MKKHDYTSVYNECRFSQKELEEMNKQIAFGNLITTQHPDAAYLQAHADDPAYSLKQYWKKEGLL